MFKYFPHTQADLEKMLKSLNISSEDDLFEDVSEKVLMKGDYNLKSEMSELDVRDYFQKLSKKNQKLTVFANQISLMVVDFQFGSI